MISKITFVASVATLNALAATLFYTQSVDFLFVVFLTVFSAFLLPTGAACLCKSLLNAAKKSCVQTSTLFSLFSAFIGAGYLYLLYFDINLPSQVIFGSHGHVQIEAPLGWRTSQDKSNEQLIHIRNRSLSESLLVLAANTDNPYYTLQDIAELALMELKTHTRVQNKLGPTACALGEYSCIQYEVEIDTEGENLTMLYTLVKGDLNSYHIMVTTSRNAFPTKIKQFKKIVRSFKERTT